MQLLPENRWKKNQRYIHCFHIVLRRLYSASIFDLIELSIAGNIEARGCKEAIPYSLVFLATAYYFYEILKQFFEKYD